MTNIIFRHSYYNLLPVKNFLVSLLILTISPLTVSAQITQHGLVQEYNEAAKKTPLAGAELRVHRAQSTVSDKNGSFVLEFMTLKPGERVSVRSIEKAGYEIFNKEAVEQWNLNPDKPFVIVMCNSAKFKQLKDLYYRNSEERYSRQYQAAKDELKQLREQNKIQEQEYFDRLRKIEENYERQLDNLDNYVDRFARIDLSELSSTEQEIINLVKEGRIEEAIARYDELGITDKLISGINQRNEVRSAIDRLSEIEGSQTQSIDSLYAMAERQVQTLMLEGNSRNNDKIRSILCQIADADTTNVDWALKTGDFIREYIADYDLALNYYRTALNNAIKQYGSELPDVANSYNNIGTIYSAKGKYDDALIHHKKALEIRKKVLGTEHPDVANSFNNIGVIYSEQGNYGEGLNYFNKALAIQEKVFGQNHPIVANSYNNIGSIYQRQGNYDEAIALHNKALEIREKAFGPEHLYVAISLNNIGTVYHSQGKYEDALIQYKKTLAIREKVLGPEHPDVARSYNNIGTICYLLGNYDSAIKYHEKSLAVSERLLGSEHPNVAMSHNEIGCIYLKQANYEKAMSEYEKALAILNALNPEHPDLARTFNNIGAAYHEHGNYEDALFQYKKALSILEKTLGPEHPDVATSYNNISSIYYDQGDYENATAQIKKAIAIQEKALGSEHPDLARSYNNIGLIYSIQNKNDDAVKYLEKSLAIREKLLGSEHPDVAALYGQIGHIYFTQREYDKALPNFKRLLEIQEKTAPDIQATKDTKNLIEDIYLILNSQSE